MDMTKLASSAMPRTVPAKYLRDETDFYSMFRGLKDPRKTTQVVFRILYLMSRFEIMQSILSLRATQAKAYCKLPRFDGDTGFDIRLKDAKDSVDDEGEKTRLSIIDIISNGGFEWQRDVDGRPGRWSGNGREHALSMPQYVTYLIRDFLVYGGAALRIEAGMDMKRYPVSWFRPVSAPRVRFADPDMYSREYREIDEVKHIEFVVLDDQDHVKYELAWNEMSYWANNAPIEDNGPSYGISPLEYAVDSLTGLKTGFRYNLTQFTENHVPRGLIQIPKLSQEKLEVFLDELEMNIGGPMGQWHSVPVVESDGVQPAAQFISFGDRPSDMQWRDYIIMNINILCSLYQVSAEEIGFQSFMTQKSTMSEQSPEARIQQGEDKGFVPLMLGLADFLNTTIVSRIDGGRWELAWQQLGGSSEERDSKLRQERLSIGFSSIEEERILADMPVRQIPINLAVWQKTESEVLKRNPELVEDPEKLFGKTMLLYAAQGGNLSIASRIPLAPQSASLLMQEIQAIQGAGDDSGGQPEAGQPPEEYGLPDEPGPEDEVSDERWAPAEDEEAQGQGQEPEPEPDPRNVKKAFRIYEIDAGG